MLIKSIKLHNIRSYEDEEVVFPDGSVLLSGDIGSGKSTILLAIEFAIFGAKKGELPAYTLLRHGKKDGFVELKMQIENKNILIKRTLKRSNDDIKQEAGYIIANGLKKDATSEEMRAITLELLGYPKDLVKKGKDLIYRYTVYTPQEEMKQILYESKETRLDTLRKVFNIDKYKRIKENSRIIITGLREKKRHLEGHIIDLDYKMKELEQRAKEVANTEKLLEDIAPKIDGIKKMISEKKRSIEHIESEMQELNSAKKELEIAENALSHKIELNNRLNEEIKKLEYQANDLKKELENKQLDDPDEIKRWIAQKEKEISESENSYKSFIKKIKELEAEISHSKKTIREVEPIDICPLCRQKVDESHKHEISSRENRNIDDYLAKINSCKEEESKLENVRLELKKEIDGLLRKEHQIGLIKLKFQNLKEKESLREEKIKDKDNTKKDIGTLNSKKAEFRSKIEKYSGIEESYRSVKKEIDELLPQERFLELEKRKYETEIVSSKRMMANLEKEISEKQKSREKSVQISELINWIEELFVKLMSAMEKHVMVSIHSQFNELFRKWFDVIMEDETLNVRVDEEFTPIIEQNGYETYIENLSGGEKTSVALSYRLALNKVINDIVAEIKTKDIIMLDEPTDGFSSEQLDKVRDVLEQLNMKQVIIVSHEGKIESFVQNVIRIEKHDNVSVVV